MLVTWDSSAQQLQNYHFIVIKVQEGAGWEALLRHPGKIMPCYN